jgi:hypothetical protein
LAYSSHSDEDIRQTLHRRTFLDNHQLEVKGAPLRRMLWNTPPCSMSTGTLTIGPCR